MVIKAGNKVEASGSRPLIDPAQNGPQGFCWLVPGLLGGTPRPGLRGAIDLDLAALKRLETRLLVSLTREWAPDTAQLARYGMQSLYAPIPDMHPPELDQASAICQAARAYTIKGQVVVFHCHAGKGRTGTLLAAMLIHTGLGFEAAIAQTRQRNPYWIETDSQLAFLQVFAQQ